MKKKFITELKKDVYKIENFFDVRTLHTIKSMLDQCRWKFRGHAGQDINKVPVNKHNPNFSINLYHPENNLEFDLRGLIVNYLESFLDYKFVLLRLKINLSLPIDRSSEYDWHWDQEEHKDTDVHKKMISGVIYLNTNDGGTEFRDKELGIINSNENTGILFPSSLEHRGVNQTNTPTRYVINYNILPWK